MAEAIIYLTEEDVSGAKQPQKSIENNSVDDLKRWLLCRGLSSRNSESHAVLIKRYFFVYFGIAIARYTKLKNSNTMYTSL